MRLLDLFCGAGGCAVGYHRAGFTDIVGVDIKPQPRYPFTFVQADAISFLIQGDRLLEKLGPFDAIHASPPCQAFSSAAFERPNRGIVKNGTLKGKHQDLVEPMRRMLIEFGKPYIIENVVGSPVEGITLCGLMFDLKMFRHRRFETSFFCLQPPHRKHSGKRVGVGGMVTMVGDGDSLRKREGYRVPPDHKSKDAWMRASGIDWMNKDEMSQAIPPAYTEFIGKQLIDNIHYKRDA